MNFFPRAFAMASLTAFLTGGACAKASDAHWQETARVSHYLTPTQLDQAKAALAALPRDKRAKVEDLLEKMAAEPATPAGVKAAREAMGAVIPTLVDPNYEGSSVEPAIRAAQLGGYAVLKGLIVRAGQAIAATPDPEAAAAALLTEARTLRALDKDAVNWFCEEAEFGLGGDLYVRAMKRLDAPSPG